MCVFVTIRNVDFSYIIPPLDGDKRLFFMSESVVKTFILKETETMH